MWTKEDNLAFKEEYEALCRKYGFVIYSLNEQPFVCEEEHNGFDEYFLRLS